MMQARSGGIARDEWRSHGHMIPACFVGVMLIAVPNYTLGVMIHPLEQAFGWSRAEISTGPLIPALFAILVAPLVGMAIDRQGPRRIALLGIPLFSAAIALMSLATADIRTWWALYALLGLASMFIFPMVWTAAINRRFARNRGLALAIALSGTGAAAAIMPTVATWLFETQGWRGAYLALGGLSFVIAFPLTWFLFRPGADIPRSAADLLSPGDRVTARRQMLSSRFARLVAAALVYSLALASLTSNSVPILLAEGFDAMTAAGIAGTIGIGTIVGRLVGGALLDRFDGRYVAAGSVVAPSISALIWVSTQGSHTGSTLACLVLGLAAGAEYDACAYLTARYFGTRNFGTLFAVIAAVALLANGVGPMLSNVVYDHLRSYDVVLWSLLPLFVLSAILFIALGKYPDEAELPAA